MATEGSGHECYREYLGGGGHCERQGESYRAQSADEVFERALSVWEGYKQRPDYWRKLALSITRRLQLVIDANGYWTKY